MEGIFKISVDKPKVEVDAGLNIENIKVTVDSSTKINSYMITCDCDWIKYERNRNDLRLIINSNNTVFERAYTIRLVHNCDQTVFATIDVIQSGLVYQLTVNNVDSKIELESTPITYEVTEINGNQIKVERNYEIKDIDVTTIGGKGEFYIKYVHQYTGRNINIGDEVYREEIVYDNGLQLKVDNEENKLIIKNYGRTFVDENNYYEIILAHKDNRSIECTIPVTYKQLSRQLNLNTKEINFDALGMVTEGTTNTVNIDFGDALDYGYGYNFFEDVDWLIVNENPTSLTFSCSVNYGAKRECKLDVYSSDEPDQIQTIKITQDEAKTRIETSVSSIVDDGNGGTYEIIIYVYGVNRTLSIGTHLDDKSNNVYDVYAYECVLSPNRTNSTLEQDIEFTVETITATVHIIQYSLVSKSNGITNMIINGNEIQIYTNPFDSQITISSSARWCTFVTTYATNTKSHIITVKCDSNIFGKMNRQCKLMITNAENPYITKFIMVTQEEDDDDGTPQFGLSEID